VSNLIIVFLLAVFAGLGYYRGAISMLTAIVTLLLASFVAYLLPGLGAGLVGIGGLCPRALRPAFGPLFLGIIVFVVLQGGCSIWLGRWKADREAQGLSAKIPGDGPLGAGLGFVWGLLVTILVLSGMISAGRAQRSVRMANAEIEVRQERRTLEVKRVTRMAQLSHQKMAPIPPAFETKPVASYDLKPQDETSLEKFSLKFESSVLAPVTDYTAPVSPRVEKTLTRVQVMLGDSALFERFQGHPVVQELMQDPNLVGLAADKEIAQLLTEHKYRELMDHPKLTALLNDKTLVAKIKALDIEKVSKDVNSPDWAPIKLH
jgi:hypothetical protein